MECCSVVVWSVGVLEYWSIGVLANTKCVVTTQVCHLVVHDKRSSTHYTACCHINSCVHTVVSS